jgi:sigma-B regulation protein RsbU (phosphoserine phosphatase)
MTTSAHLKTLRALIIEDSEFDAAILVSHLEKEGYTLEWRRVETAEDMAAALREQDWDIIFSDHQMPEFSADDALKVLQKAKKDVPFIIVSGGIGEDKAVALMKAGAHDFVIKGELTRLPAAVDRELKEARIRASHRATEELVRENERRLRLLWERSPDAILMMDEAGAIAYVNPAAETVFGYSATEMASLNIRDLITPPETDSADPARAGTLPWLAIADDPERSIRELTGRHRSGSPLILEAGFSRLEMEGRRWCVAFIRDITQRRRAERALAAREQEFALARAVQRRLYPQSAPRVEGLEIAGATQPADETGGDYYDYLRLANGDLGLVVGDVTGHGMGPALIMAETRAYLRIVGVNRQNTGEVLTRANQTLAEDLEGTDRFVTCTLARICPATRALAYANAGHLAGCVLSADGAIKARLKRRGPPLGMLPGVTYQEHEGPTLEPGDLLLLHTDGIEEAERADGECFGFDRLLAVLRQNRARSAAEITRAIPAAVTEFLAGRPRQDDLTLIVLKVR